jgi:hypothetical protein
VIPQAFQGKTEGVYQTKDHSFFENFTLSILRRVRKNAYVF